MDTVTDWKALATARGLKLEDAELERLVEPLRALEQRFRPLALALNPTQYPAEIFRAEGPGE